MAREILWKNITIITLLSIISNVSLARVQEYGRKICNKPGFKCLEIKRNDSWGALFPDEEKRELVKRLNRFNGFLKQGMKLAVPVDLNRATLFGLSPLPLRTEKYNGEKWLVIDQSQMAWGAYNRYGQLMNWGPLSAGSKKCFETANGCQTPVGEFHIQRKKGENCFSRSYPQRVSGENGGAYMPYCMFFYKGYAIHGSRRLPGYHASHGCVRLLLTDANWLYEYFVDAGKAGEGTKVVILPYSESLKRKRLISSVPSIGFQ